MEISRNKYLDKLIKYKQNGQIKIITGIRRCGKSYLLFNIFKNYLIDVDNVDSNNIIEVTLDDISNIKLRNPFELDSYIREKINNKDIQYYVFIDEIQLVESIENPYINNSKNKVSFVDVLLGLMKINNLDIYVTGSNSKMLSSDILTEFRGRGTEIRISPLTYKEFYEAFNDSNNALREYYTYGGMPYLLYLDNHEDKSKYLTDLFEKIYLQDILERNNIRSNKEILNDLLNMISSSIGSLTNPSKLSNAFKSMKQISITSATINLYLDYFIDSFLINKAFRYDVKGKKYFNTPLKYYFTDVGLRNARLNFRQQEENHIMENIIYNELISRGFDVDVGVVEYNYKDENGISKRKQLEIDFIANKVSKRYYIQSALYIDTKEKRKQEINSLTKVDDSFKKIVVIKDNIIPWHDENGILYVGIEEFLLNENIIDF